MPASAVAGGEEVAIRIRLMDLYVDTNEDPVNGCPVGPDFSPFENQVRYLGPPSAFDDNDTVSTPQFVAAELQCTPFYRDWSPAALTADFGAGVDTSAIYYYGTEVLPCSVYEAQQATQAFIDEFASEDCFSAPLEIRTALWGDIWPPFGEQVSFIEIGRMVLAFRSIPFFPGDPPDGGPRKMWPMLRENSAPFDSPLNFTDIGKTVEAFKFIPYAEDGPTACP